MEAFVSSTKHHISTTEQMLRVLNSTIKGLVELINTFEVSPTERALHVGNISGFFETSANDQKRDQFQEDHFACHTKIQLQIQTLQQEVNELESKLTFYRHAVFSANRINEISSCLIDYGFTSIVRYNVGCVTATIYASNGCYEVTLPFDPSKENGEIYCASQRISPCSDFNSVHLSFEDLFEEITKITWSSRRKAWLLSDTS